MPLFIETSLQLLNMSVAICLVYAVANGWNKPTSIVGDALNATMCCAGQFSKQCKGFSPKAIPTAMRQANS